MSIRHIFAATVLALASSASVHADSLRPIDARSIDLGEVAGVAYYTVERDGFHVVTTLAQGATGTPVRVVSVLAPGQRVTFSTSQKPGALEIGRNGDSVYVRETITAPD